MGQNLATIQRQPAFVLFMTYGAPNQRAPPAKIRRSGHFLSNHCIKPGTRRRSLQDPRLLIQAPQGPKLFLPPQLGLLHRREPLWPPHKP